MTLDTSRKVVSGPTLSRLPLYHQYIIEQQMQGTQHISSVAMAEHLKLIPVLVRKDLASTGCIGLPKLGFPLQKLLKTIEHTLGWDNVSEAFLVGVGALGKALMEFHEFSKHGVKITAGFDIHEKLIHTTISGKKILPLEKLVPLMKRMHIHLGIITVPASSAQDIADLLVEGGVKGIWNFAPCELEVPPHIIVKQENLSQSLALLASQVRL